MVAPIAKNTAPSTPPAPAAAPPAGSAPARAPAAPPLASDVRRQAADDVHTLQQASAPAAPRASQVAYQRAVDQAAATYLEGGGAALRVQLGRDPAMLSSLANADDRRLERDLEASFERQATGLHSLITGTDAGSVSSIVDSVASDRIRLGIVQDAQVRVNAQTHALLAMRQALPELLPSLRNAQPGTEAADQARALGIRGDAGDLVRAQQTIDRSLVALERFMGHMRGQAGWEVTAFPGAAGRSARRSNLAGASEGVAAAGAARLEQDADAHALVQGAEYAHLAVEVGEVALHVARGAAVLGGVAGAVVTAGMIALTTQAYERGVEDIAAQQRLGLRLGL